MHNKLKALFCAALLLTGCSQPVTITSQQARLDYLANMQRWQAKGRVAIRDRDDGHVASITWRQQSADYDIFLANPLASQSLHVTPANINDTYLFDVPVTQMRYWLKGMPSPHSPIQQASYNSHQQLEHLQQDGWSIDYLSYSAYPPIMLPEKIVANKDDINIKIIINCWNR